MSLFQCIGILLLNFMCFSAFLFCIGWSSETDNAFVVSVDFQNCTPNVFFFFIELQVPKKCRFFFCSYLAQQLMESHKTTKVSTFYCSYFTIDKITIIIWDDRSFYFISLHMKLAFLSNHPFTWTKQFYRLWFIQFNFVVFGTKYVDYFWLAILLAISIVSSFLVNNNNLIINFCW